MIAVGLDPTVGAKPSKRLNEAYGDLAVALGRAFPAEGKGDAAMLEAILKRGLTPTVETDDERWRCLHWPLAIPEVMGRGGFDAIVGNPPFIDGKTVSRFVGKNVREWCVEFLANGKRGSADIVAYFFLRALSLVNKKGALGLIATNTIAQGGTRRAGLDLMIKNGFTIVRAIRSRDWPAKSANLEYAAVWGTRSQISDNVLRVCDDRPATRISSLLESEGHINGEPTPLSENKEIAFIGCNINGKGFEVPPSKARAMISENHSNEDVLKPLLGGDEINGIPNLQAPAYVVDMYPRDLERSAMYLAPFTWIEHHVIDYRRSLANKPNLRERWWRFERDAIKLRNAMNGLDEVLVIALTSNALMPVRVPTGQVFQHSLGVFATESYSEQAVLSSSLHQAWVITYGSTLETRVRYTPSDVFETFPRPDPTDALEAIGRTLDTERREIMLRRDLGLTKLYNLVNDPDRAPGVDPDVDRLRQIHRELDEAVAAAYGWEDIPLDHGFHTYRKMTRWTVSPVARVELLDRLLEENHRRAAAQAPAQPAKKPRRKRSPEPVQEETLDV